MRDPTGATEIEVGPKVQQASSQLQSGTSTAYSKVNGVELPLIARVEGDSCLGSNIGVVVALSAPPLVGANSLFVNVSVCRDLDTWTNARLLRIALYERTRVHALGRKLFTPGPAGSLDHIGTVRIHSGLKRLPGKNRGPRERTELSPLGRLGERTPARQETDHHPPP